MGNFVDALSHQDNLIDRPCKSHSRTFDTVGGDEPDASSDFVSVVVDLSLQSSFWTPCGTHRRGRC